MSIKTGADCLIVSTRRMKEGKEVWRTYAVRRDGATAGRLRLLAKRLSYKRVHGRSVLTSYGRCRSVSRDINLRWCYDISGEPSLVGGSSYGFIYVS
jgi:hypothetical protein